MVWRCACGLDIIVRLLLSLFPLCELSLFSTSMYRQWAPCERNSSYNFIPIFLKLCTCFPHGQKMCMWFGCNPCINFCHFFHFANYFIFWPQIIWKCCDSGYLVSVTPHTILYQSFWNFLKLCTCFSHGLEMCMWFWYNPWITFCHFFDYVIFWPQTLWKFRDSGYLVSTTPHTILYLSFWNFAHVFAMVWRCAYGLDIILELIFATFSTLSFSDLRFYESIQTGFCHTWSQTPEDRFSHGSFNKVFSCTRGANHG